MCERKKREKVKVSFTKYIDKAKFFFSPPQSFILVTHHTQPSVTFKMSTISHPPVFSCLLCGGVLPSALDDLFVSHVREQHRAYFNMEFLHAAFFLDGEELKKTKEFIESLTNNKEEHSSFAKLNDETRNELIENLDYEIEKYIEIKLQENKVEQIVLGEVEKKPKPDAEDADESKLKVKPGPTEKKSPKCDCNIIWKNKKEKAYHKKIVHKNYFNCETCKKAFKESDKFQSHILAHSKKIKSNSNICEECGYVASNKYNVATHKKLKHDDQIQICDICSKDFQGGMKLKIHKRRFHRSSQQCPQCDKVFKNLTKHLRTIHTSESDKKYQCDQCGKGFIDKTRLSTHKLSVHTDKKPFPCRFKCGYACSDAGNRNKHEKSKHGGLGGQVVKFEGGFDFE